MQTPLGKPGRQAWRRMTASQETGLKHVSGRLGGKGVDCMGRFVWVMPALHVVSFFLLHVRCVEFGGRGWRRKGR